MQILRFCAAIMVIASHAFPLSRGADNKDWLSIFTNGQVNGGGLAVYIFFLIGGIFAAKSMIKQKSFSAYFRGRIFRLFPPLIFVVMISAFILGPLFITETLQTYFTNGITYRYLLNRILVLQHNLPGVFRSNVYGTTVNGALWTLPVEFLCYIICFLTYKLGFLCKRNFILTFPLVLVGTVLLNRLSGSVFLLKQALIPCLMFYIGVAFYIYRDKIQLNKINATIFLLLLAVFAQSTFLDIALLVLLPYILLTVVFMGKQRFSKISVLGDWSYGIYLWGFPCQQMLVSLHGGVMNPYENMIGAVFMSIALSVVSYYLIEKPFINLDKKRRSAYKIGKH